MQHFDTHRLLDAIQTPEDVKKLHRDELPQLCKELRDYIIEVLSHNPGHLASGLGVVELTVALHYVFNTPDDKLIWDVGHQAYPHKVLTGRKDEFPGIRTLRGISGFPKMSESIYDAFGTGHASTSISAVLGMAVADAMQGNTTRQHIAVIGDGSMTGGMAFEALNHAGDTNANILIILNDNGIAIDKNVGALGLYLTQITASPTYNRLKNKVWNFLSGRKEGGKRSKNFFRTILNGIKSLFAGQSNFFEALDIRYFGPVAGHDVQGLVKMLSDLKTVPGPKLLHVITRKGKGLDKAEEDPTRYHAPGTFNPETGEIILHDINGTPKKFQDVFGDAIIELAEKNEKIIGITPAMPSGCSLSKMMAKMPHRAFDVGIAEPHSVTFSAGMAAAGMIPFCNIYSSFMQRAYDQVIHDVALQNLHVVFCLDRGGLVGEDGATHQGVFDLAYFRPIPNLTICSPLNEEELRDMMYTAQLPENASPFVIRYPRGKGVLSAPYRAMQKMEIGKGEELRSGIGLAFVVIGPIGNDAMKVADLLKEQGIDVGVYNMRFLKPIDTDLLEHIATHYSKIITVEDGVIEGGLGTAVIEFFNDRHHEATIVRLGVPDCFIEHGKVEELRHECGFDVEGMVNAARNILKK